MMIKVIITAHAHKRLNQCRQNGISPTDVIRCARIIPGAIPTATRFCGYISESGRPFDIVAKDIIQGRLVITVIGK
jgi:hypothetical protein